MARRQGSSSLQEFIQVLEREGQLHRITAEVDPYLEASAIAIRSMYEDGPAIIFENIKGSKYPLAMNLLSSDRRVELAIGAHPGDLGHELIHLAERAMPPKPRPIWEAARPLLPRLLGARVKHTGDAPSQHTVDEPDLNELPILQTWPDDGGRFITLPQVVTYDPSTHKRNIGMYRIHVFDQRETGIHWQIQKGGGFHYVQAERLNQPFEVAVVVGSDPSLLLATIAPLPEGIDEAMFAGFLRGKPTRMSRGKSISIDVPSDAEFVLEGIVPPDDRRLEGPFGDHYGHYSHAGMFPVFKLKKITHRDRPIFAATVVGKPPMEDKWLGDATQLVLGPLARLTHPEVKGVWAYYEAGFHNLLGVAANQRYAKEAMKTALSLSTDAQLSLTKCAVIVSEGVDNRNFRKLIRAIGDNFDARYDFLLLQNVPLDTLDFTSYTMNLGSKMLIDATQKMPSTASGGKYPVRKESEFYQRTGRAAQRVEELDHRISDHIVIEDTLLVVKVRGPFNSVENAAKKQEHEFSHPGKTIGREVVEKLVANENIEKLPKGIKIVAAVSEDVNLQSDMEVMWGIFTRFDAARDVTFTRSQLVGISPVHEGIMGIDATWKIGYPNPCIIPDDVQQRVDQRWREYGFL